ncbi:MAG: HRDC domain-containing protein [Planctomycetota bacterium]
MRKSLAERDGVPIYAVFTNEQLAEIVRRDVSSVTEFSKIRGVGKSKIDKYSGSILKAMSAARKTDSNVEHDGQAIEGKS